MLDIFGQWYIWYYEILHRSVSGINDSGMQIIAISGIKRNVKISIWYRQNELKCIYLCESSEPVYNPLWKTINSNASS